MPADLPPTFVELARGALAEAEHFHHEHVVDVRGGIDELRQLSDSRSYELGRAHVFALLAIADAITDAARWGST